jgi:DNA-binding GntR family transcriptional regulator
MGEVTINEREFSKIKLASLNNECYQRIKNAILNGQLSWGERLDVGRLADKFGISKFPVIKAIDRLAIENLVTVIPNKGSFVMTPTVHDVKEVNEIRMIIELNALLLAAEKNLPGLIEMIEENEDRQTANIPYYYKGQRFQEFLEYDREYHLCILICSGNERLLNYYGVIRSQVELFRIKTFETSNVKRTHDSHLEILNLLKKREIDKSRELLKTHLEQVHQEILDTIGNAGAPGAYN